MYNSLRTLTATLLAIVIGCDDPSPTADPVLMLFDASTDAASADGGVVDAEVFNCRYASAPLEGCSIVDSAGNCCPIIEACEAGHLPTFATGCQPRPPAACAEANRVEGACLPRHDGCPSGMAPTIPGCEPVGISTCSDTFMTESRGCRPTSVRCEAGMLPIPSRGCIPLEDDEACALPWGGLAAGIADIHVDPTAQPDMADGSRDRPFASIQAAVTGAVDGARIILAPGEYPEDVRLFRKDLWLVGACRSQVRLTGAGTLPANPDIPFSLHLESSTVHMQNLTIGGEGIGIMAIRATLTLHRVSVAGARGAGIYSFNSTLAMDETRIEGTRSGFDDSPFTGSWGGVGLSARDSQVTVTRSHLQGNHFAGAAIVGEAGNLEITDTVIESTQPEPRSGISGYGVMALGDAEFSVSDTSIVDNYTAGLHAYAGAHGVVARSIIDSTRTPSGRGAFGVIVSTDAEASVLDSIISLTQGVGIANQSGVRVSVERSWIRDNSHGGIEGSAGTMVINESVVSTNGLVGMIVHDGANMEIARTAVLGQRGTNEASLQGGIVAADGAILQIEDSVVLESPATGITLVRGATGAVSRSYIRGTHATRRSGLSGAGIVAVFSTLSLDTVVVDNNSTFGIYVQDSALDAENVAALHTRANEDGRYGAGLMVDRNSTATIDGLLAHRNASAGAIAWNAASLELENFVLTEAQESDWLDGAGDEHQAMADGLLTLETPVRIRRGFVAGNPRAGLLLSGGSGTAGEKIVTTGARGVVAQSSEVLLTECQEIDIEVQSGGVLQVPDGAEFDFDGLRR